MPNYAVIRMIPLKTLSSIYHTQREATRQKQYDDINKEASENNITLLHQGQSNVELYKKAIQTLDYYTKKTKDGKTHKEPTVKELGFVCTFSPEAEPYINKQKWIEKNIQYFKKKFADCPMNFYVHKDEKTYHMHVYVVPIKNGKISKNKYISGKNDLIQLQDEYAEAMSDFGLQRGKQGSKSNHLTKAEYNKMLERQFAKKKYKELDEISKDIEQKLKTQEGLEKYIKGLTQKAKDAEQTAKNAEQTAKSAQECVYSVRQELAEKSEALYEVQTSIKQAYHAALEKLQYIQDLANRTVIDDILADCPIPKEQRAIEAVQDINKIRSRFENDDLEL